MAVNLENPAYEYVKQQRDALGRKFDEHDVRSDTLLLGAARDFLQEWEPTGSDVDGFLRSVKSNSMRYGLSAGQAKGVLNILAFQMRPAVAVKGKELGGTPIPNGFYTIVFNGDDTDYVTLRVRESFRSRKQPTKYVGEQEVGFLYGPNNTRDYRNFGFIRATTYSVWGKMEGMVKRQEAAIAYLIQDGLDAQNEGRETYAKQSGLCARCGRELTVPLSLHRGVGPECAKILGVA